MSAAVVRHLSERRQRQLLSAVVAAVSLCAGAGFAAHQEIWMDETTQLCGISLGPVEVVKWLAGKDRDRFGGIPGDRMPPVSYWVQWTWSQLFGLNEHALRMLAVVVMALAAVIVANAAARTWGTLAGWVAGLTFALSPNVVYTGVEIRAYPFLVLFSASAFSFLLRLGGEEGAGSTRSWVGLALSCLGAAYSHYFGLVLTGSAFVAAGSMAIRRRAMWRPWLSSAASIAVGAVGLLPFVRSAVGMGAGGHALARTGLATVRLFYRGLGGHASWTVYLPELAAGLLGVALSLGVALLPKGPATRQARTLVLALGCGVAVEFAARLLMRGFDTLQATYNLWVIPAVILAGASAVAAENRSWRIAGRVGAGLLLAANATAALVLVTHGEVFAHSAGDRINLEIARLGGPSEVAVVIEAPGTEWQSAFCPLRYVFGESIVMYRADWRPDGALDLLRVPDEKEVAPLSAIHARHLAVIHVADIGAEGVVGFLHTHNPPVLSDDRVRDAFAAHGWAPEKKESLVALKAEQVDWLEPSPR